MTTLATFCSRCQFKFPKRSYKFCPMCGVTRLPISLESSSTDELEDERSVGTTRPSSLPIPTYEQIYVHHPQSVKEVGKLYGKKFLVTYYKDEYHKYLNNQMRARDWLLKEEGLFEEDLTKNREQWRAVLTKAMPRT